jgi:hypothetical protein
MLDYRRRERERKSASKGSEKSKANHPVDDVSLGVKEKNDDEVLRQYVANNRMNAPATTDLLSKEITVVEPFNAFPIKIEPYMLELLTSCELPPLSHPPQPYVQFHLPPSVFPAQIGRARTE